MNFKSQKVRTQNTLRSLLTTTNDNNYDKVNDKSLNVKQTSSVTIPEHLRSSLPDPLQHFSKQESSTPTLLNEKQSDKELSSEIERLKKELAAIQKKKDAKKPSYKSKDMLKKLKETSQNIPSPPPSIFIRNSKIRKKRK